MKKIICKVSCVKAWIETTIYIDIKAYAFRSKLFPNIMLMVHHPLYGYGEQERKHWMVSEYTSGLKISRGNWYDTRKDAIDNAIAVLLNRRTELHGGIKKFATKYNIAMPVNDPATFPKVEPI